MKSPHRDAWGSPAVSAPQFWILPSQHQTCEGGSFQIIIVLFLNITAWKTSSKNHPAEASKPLKLWEVWNDCSFKPLVLGWFHKKPLITGTPDYYLSICCIYWPPTVPDAFFLCDRNVAVTKQTNISLLEFNFSEQTDKKKICIVLEGAKVRCEVAQSCPTLCDPMDYSLPGSSVHGIFQARILEWVAISSSRRSSRPGDWTRVSCIVGRCFTIWATREAQKSGRRI